DANPASQIDESDSSETHEALRVIACSLQYDVALALLEFLRGDHDLDAVAYLELLHQHGHVMLDRLFADLDRGGDLLVGLSVHQESDDLLFANAENDRFRRLAPQRGVAKSGDHPAGKAVGDIGFAGL